MKEVWSPIKGYHIEYEMARPLNEVEAYQRLFNFFKQEHNLILTDSELDEIVHEVDFFKSKFNQ